MNKIIANEKISIHENRMTKVLISNKPLDKQSFLLKQLPQLYDPEIFQGILKELQNIGDIMYSKYLREFKWQAEKFIVMIKIIIWCFISSIIFLEFVADKRILIIAVLIFVIGDRKRL